MHSALGGAPTALRGAASRAACSVGARSGPGGGGVRRRTSCHACAAGTSHGANQCHGLSGPSVKCSTRSDDAGSGHRSL
jgi:hypothetical protein